MYGVCIMSMYSSIQILPATRERLAHLKSGRETYDELLNKLLKLVPEGDAEGQYTDEFRLSLLNARIDLRSGQTVKLAAAKKSLGL